jgi:redox-sensitive bicupin YhaK (pirin superfamily)
MNDSRIVIVSAQTRDIGFPVRRLLPASAVRSLGPFVFLDHMGPAYFPAGSTLNDVRAHPHIGLATVTYLFSGAMMHRDSLGVEQRIEPGAVNWMCAGAGIVHSERIPEDVRANQIAVEGIQMWVALPLDQETCAPAFHHTPADALPQWHDAHSHWTLLIGTWGAHRSPVTQASDTFYATGQLAAGSQIAFPRHVGQRGLYVAQGCVQIDGATYAAGTLAVLVPEADHCIEVTKPSRVMLLGGAPLDAPRHMWWNFVSSRRERIAQARTAWEQGKFAPVPGETERIPAPPL